MNKTFPQTKESRQ